MNKQLIGLILALCFSVTALAEAEMDTMANKRAEHLTKELGLNTEQKVKVEAIFATQKEKFKALHEETNASLKAVLTPEQQTKFDALKEQRQKVRQERRKAHADKKQNIPAASVTPPTQQ